MIGHCQVWVILALEQLIAKSTKEDRLLSWCDMWGCIVSSFCVCSAVCLSSPVLVVFVLWLCICVAVAAEGSQQSLRPAELWPWSLSWVRWLHGWVWSLWRRSLWWQVAPSLSVTVAASHSAVIRVAPNFSFGKFKIQPFFPNSASAKLDWSGLDWAGFNVSTNTV